MPKIIPFRDRILVKRKKVGEVAVKEDSKIVMPDTIQDQSTDIAEIRYLPDLSLADEKIIEKSEEIVNALGDKASQGDSGALNALLEMRDYLMIKSLKVGDKVMMGKYVGTMFRDNQEDEDLTLVSGYDIIARCV